MCVILSESGFTGFENWQDFMLAANPERVKYLSESGFTGFENWQDFIPIKKNCPHVSCWLPTREQVEGNVVVGV
ncbi:MAG: hypothetical protein LBJ57_01115 [Prevotellaceae bacterium]|jgi:hypothetical protein|nr:hypothetical protein [Prevotellaceae bacterium]